MAASRGGSMCAPRSIYRPFTPQSACCYTVCSFLYSTSMYGTAFSLINVALFISLVLFALVFMHLAGGWCVLFVPCSCLALYCVCVYARTATTGHVVLYFMRTYRTQMPLPAINTSVFSQSDRRAVR